MMKKYMKNFGFYILLFAIIMVIFTMYTNLPAEDPKTYNDLYKEIVAGRVQELTIVEQNATAVLKDGNTMDVTIPPVEQFHEDLGEIIRSQMDNGTLKMVDYPLLLTFVFFFVFAGNMARIDVVRWVFSALMEHSALLFSVLSCQCISNVPSAILLSQFTGNYADLLVGVNIGGVGTLIASLASLITFREYLKHNPGKTGYYVGLFSAFNFGFLIILTSFMLLTKSIF